MVASGVDPSRYEDFAIEYAALQGAYMPAGLDDDGKIFCKMDIYDGRTHVDLPKMLRPFGCYIATKVVAPHAKGDIFESIEGFNLGWSPVSKAYIIQLPTGRVATAVTVRINENFFPCRPDPTCFPVRFGPNANVHKPAWRSAPSLVYSPTESSVEHSIVSASDPSFSENDSFQDLSHDFSMSSDMEDRSNVLEANDNPDSPPFQSFSR